MGLRKELKLLWRRCLHHWNLVYRLKNLLQPLRHHILRIPPTVINLLLIALLFHMRSLRLLLNWTFFMMDLYLVCTTIKLYTRLEKKMVWMKKILCLFVLYKVPQMFVTSLQVKRWTKERIRFSSFLNLIPSMGRVSALLMAAEFYAMEKTRQLLLIICE